MEDTLIVRNYQMNKQFFLCGLGHVWMEDTPIDWVLDEGESIFFLPFLFFCLIFLVYCSFTLVHFLHFLIKHLTY